MAATECSMIFRGTYRGDAACHEQCIKPDSTLHPADVTTFQVLGGGAGGGGGEADLDAVPVVHPTVEGCDPAIVLDYTEVTGEPGLDCTLVLTSPAEGPKYMYQVSAVYDQGVNPPDAIEAQYTNDNCVYTVLYHWDSEVDSGIQSINVVAVPIAQ
jgi:hypothetical protein